MFPEVFELSSLNGTNGFVLRGAAAGDQSGVSVALGDVNGDGFDDLIVGAPHANVSGYYAAGETYIVFGNGRRVQPDVELADLRGSNGYTIVGFELPGGSGYSVASAGDINGDGIGDLVIGAPAVGYSFYFSGRVYVVFGEESPSSPTFDLATLDGTNGFTLEPLFLGYDGDNLGRSVSGAGDINGDGIDDIIVGAETTGPDYEGEAYVVFGQREPFDPLISLNTLDGSNGFAIRDADFSDNLGSSVSAAGDVNGDGIADVIVGGEGGSGAYVIFGDADGFPPAVELSTIDGEIGFRILGAADRTGSSVSAAGDINHDGIDDLIIGADYGDPDGRTGAGRAYVVFGSADGFSPTLDVSQLDGSNGFVMNGVAPGDGVSAVSSAGDLNGDGIDDVAIGAARADPDGRTDAGSTYIVFGSASGFAPTLELAALDGNNGFVVNGVAEGDQSGYDLAAGSDLNGDGIDDLVIGARRADPDGRPDAGASYVVFGLVTPRDLVGSPRDDTLSGTLGADTIAGRGGDDILDGLDGTDRIHGNAGNDTILGGGDADRLAGGLGKDVIFGGAGQDRIEGNHGGDRLFGEAGRDVINGGGGDDLIESGAGADTARGDAGDDRIDGGGGADTLAGGGGNDTLSGRGGNDAVWGGAGDDVASGGRGNDVVMGGDGRDSLSGGGGDDLLFGDMRRDTLHGGAGSDTLLGGHGADVFAFVQGDGEDVVADFEPGRDKLGFAGAGLSLADITLTRAATDILVFYGVGDDFIRLQGVTLASLSPDDFQF